MLAGGQLGPFVVGVVGGQVEVDHEQVFVELRGAGEHGAVGRDDDRVAVEDQVVLAADQVHVGQGAPGLGRPGG